MLVHAVLFKIRHHVGKSRLSSRLSSFLLNLIHLLKVFLSHRVQLCAEAFLSLERSCLGFRNLIYFEATAHSRMHHDFAWSLDFLQTVQRDIIEVAGAVQVPFLVPHHLLKKVVTARFSLLSFQKQIIC